MKCLQEDDYEESAAERYLNDFVHMVHKPRVPDEIEVGKRYADQEETTRRRMATERASVWPGHDFRSVEMFPLEARGIYLSICDVTPQAYLQCRRLCRGGTAPKLEQTLRTL